ncbi:trypsin-like peptidase domain-containing protein [Inquilinus limosus]|uniref:trypsin-like serine peptidase n=1 Tax=Inquilinus limosus TaxID=171674 RepID=UPI003F162AD8
MARGSGSRFRAKTPRTGEAGPVEDDGSLVLPSLMAQTNGGGSPETVPGFDLFRAVTAGFETRRIVGPTLLAARPDGGFFSQGGGTASFGIGSPASKPENVVGADSRVMVPDTSMTPWRCICHLEIEYESGPVGFGTGFLIGPETVATAAHVLVDRSTYGWAKPRQARRIRVVPGRNGTLAPYGYFVAGFEDGCRVPASWLDPATTPEQAAREDYATISTPASYRTADEPTGERLGYFGLKAFTTAAAARNASMLFVNNAGYPYEADKPYGSLWYNAGRVREVGDAFIEYMVDTEGGQSGSPIYYFDEERNQRYAIGIHTTGDFVNRGLRITPAIFQTLRRWAKR